jgi:hypothetical protein
MCEGEVTRANCAEQGILFIVFIIYVPLTTVHFKKRLATFRITFFYGLGTFGTPTERYLADEDENRINSFKDATF